MEKVLFIYVDYNENDPTIIGGTVSHGLAALAGALRSKNIAYSLLQLTTMPGETDLACQLDKYRDHRIIALSFTTMRKNENYRLAGLLKRLAPGKCIIAGGTHPSVSPEEVIAQDGIDYVCVGEGENSLPEFVAGYPASGEINLTNWYTKKGRVGQPAFNYPASLDNYPLPDYSIFDFPKMHCHKARIKYLPVMISRGCPFSCAFCSAYVINRITGNRAVRLYSPERAIALLQQSLRFADFKSVSFDDDVLGIDRMWTMKFFALYQQEIRLPFKSYVRPEFVDEGMVMMMKRAGCYRVTFGVETGDETIRKTILGKNVTNAEFVRCFALFRKYGISFNSTNMIGLPTETMRDALKTIKFNAQNDVDMALAAIFIPYPFTKLFAYCREQGLYKDLADVGSCGEYLGSPLRLPGFSDRQLRFTLAAWNMLMMIYRAMYKRGWSRLIPAFDALLMALSPLYPLLVWIRSRFFFGVIATRRYAELEKPLAWI